jgi:cytochrome oxidase Cu insertion factor (SCO1/SenC/PrrC family)
VNTADNKNRMTLLLIAGIPVMIILASSWLWYYVASGRLDLVDILGTANRGSLLEPPVNLADLQAVDKEGLDFDPGAEAKPRWRIMVPGRSDCDANCRQLLYYTRQMHTAMGKYQNRIERVFLGIGMDGSESLNAELRQRYPRLKLLYTPSASFQTQLDSRRITAEQPVYYLVDPRGWIILSYQAETDGGDLMADLKFLLKNSNG